MLGVGGFFFAGCAPAAQTAVSPPAVAQPSGIIRSAADLQRYVAATAQSGSPLSALSQSGLQRFVSSVTFNSGGITGFRYDDLQSELTASQIYDVLSLFGAQKDVAIIPSVRIETAADRRVMSYVDPNAGDGSGDYPGYACASRATCAPESKTICTHNC
jgi:hypothetical protein